MFFKFGLILLRHSSTGSVLFHSPLRSYSIYFHIHYLLLLIITASCSKRFLISLSILSLIDLELFSFFLWSEKISYIFNFSVM